MMQRLIPFFILFLACSGQTVQEVSKVQNNNRRNRTEKIIFQGVEILIKNPDSIHVKGDLLLLPGWNYSNTKWCDSTGICTRALSQGFRVIAPQMGQSIYATKYFPETRKDLAKYPTLLWLDSAINYLRDSMHYFEGKKYVLGLSTGARGVALICEKRPGFFSAAAALSGDYNQLTMPADPLCTLVYGPFSKFKQRWTDTDNPEIWLKTHAFTTPIFLGHGAQDKIVPVQQTVRFNKALLEARKRDSSSVITEYHIAGQKGHNFSYWRSEMQNVWSFFMKH